MQLACQSFHSKSGFETGSNNYWLYNQLQDKSGLTIHPDYSELLVVSTASKTFRIYCPDSDEYLLTSDIVQKVADMGGNTISYATAWCRATTEAIKYGEKHGINVVPYAALFKMLES